MFKLGPVLVLVTWPAIPFLLGCSETASPPSPPLRAVDVAPRPLPRIAPGTVLGERPPAGWTHDLLLSRPRVAQGDIDAVPSAVEHSTGLFSLSVLARVVPGDGGGPPAYRLDEVAVGVALEVDGRHRIVDGEHLPGADLGWVGRMTLAEHERYFANEMRQIARSSLACVFDGPGLFLCEGAHREMIVRYLVLADPTDGDVELLAWLLDSRDGAYVLAEAAPQRLPPRMREDRMLNVKREHFTLGVPTRDAFAVVQIPQGTPVAFTPRLKQVASLAPYTEESLAILEEETRRLLRDTAERD